MDKLYSLLNYSKSQNGIFLKILGFPKPFLIQQETTQEVCSLWGTLLFLKGNFALAIYRRRVGISSLDFSTSSIKSFAGISLCVLSLWSTHNVPKAVVRDVKCHSGLDFLTKSAKHEMFLLG